MDEALVPGKPGLELLADPGDERLGPCRRESQRWTHEVNTAVGVERPIWQDRDEAAGLELPDHQPLAGAENADSCLGGLDEGRAVV